MNTKHSKSSKKPSRSITMNELGEFTEQVLLPGVERLMEPLEQEVKKGFEEMRRGFVEVGKSIRTLAGDIIEVKVEHKERITKLEEKVRV